MTSPPPDALVARTIRSLTRVLVAGGAAAVALGLAAVAVLVLTEADPGAATGPVLSLLALGQVSALGTAGVGAVGTWRVLRPAAPAGAGAGASAADAEAAAGVLARTARRLVVLARATVLACVVAVVVWVFAAPGDAFGALLGGLVAAQVAVLDVTLARRLV